MPVEPGPLRFLVVGAGSAGCVVAGRLAEAGASTMLIEAGPVADGHDSAGSAGLIEPQRHSHRFWSPLSEVRLPTDSSPALEHPYWMGRGMGGGSAVNAMLVTTGDRADYDRWARFDGCSEWSSEAMVPWLTRATTALNPEVRIASAETAELVSTFDGAFSDIGLEPAGTTLEEGRCGLFTPMLATENGARRSVSDAYLEMDNPNLSVRAGEAVASLLVENGAVCGVTMADGEAIQAPTVILTAGIVETARLLRRTGVVGQAGDWIRNHAAASVPVPWPVGADPDRSPQVHRVARWSAEVSGPKRQGTGDTAATGPDLMAMLMGPFRDPAGATGIVSVMASTVQSSGRLDFEGDRARLISNRLTNADDVVRLRRGTQRVLTVCQRLARLTGATSRRAALIRDIDDLARLAASELDAWLIEHPGPVYHAVGSCRMGDHDAGAVTEAEPGRAGLVHGLDGVVVADASLFPDLVTGGLQLPVMAVAERVTAETLLGHLVER